MIRGMTGQPDSTEKPRNGEMDYGAFCRAARRLTGVDLGQYRREQTERRIRALARRRGANSLVEYVVLLRRSQEEREIFRDRVTINVSQLWRNPEHWSFLASEVLPRLAARRGTTRAWSAGCSYGAEPYTLAMLWREVNGRRPVTILGTDIDEASIGRARMGTFSDEDVRDVPPDVRQRWLERRADGAWHVAADLRRHVRFEVADIFAAPEPGSHDLVLCRNVVIYMTPERRDLVHRLLVRALEPGGYLMVGATERVSKAASLGLQPIHPFIYRKVGEQAAAGTGR